MSRPVATWAAPLLALAVAAGVFLAGVWLLAANMQFGAITADWAWLYRTGQSIWAHGLPAQDLFSWTFPHRHWVLYQWLFEALAAPLYSALGLSCSVFAVGAIAVLSYAVLPALILRRDGVHPLWTMVLGALVLIPASTNLGLRPMLASNFALLAQYALVRRLRAGDTTLPIASLATAVIYALWSNMHLGFTLGLFSLVLFALGDLWTRARDRQASALRPAAYAALLVVAVAASGANPYGWSLYGYIVHLSLENQMNAHIHELMPPAANNRYMQVGAALLALFAALLVWRRRVLSAAELLHVVLFSAMAFTAMRFVIWAALFYVLVAPRLVASAAHRSSPARLNMLMAPLATPAGRATTMLVLCLAGAGAITLGAPATAGPARLADCAPLRRALVYLDRHYPADTHWYSSEKAGSCARFYTPNRRVFIDTRFDMYPEAFVMAWFRAYQYRQHWRAVFRHWDIRVALMPRGAPLIEPLRHDRRWQLVYRDAGALVFVRRDGAAPADRGPTDHEAGRTAARSAD